MYSDISTLISESSLSKRYFERTFASSVLPTPVGPRKINEPIGFLGSFRPTLFLLIALTSLSIASSCPITFFDNTLDMPKSLLLSFWAILSTGMPVTIDTTSEIFFSFTLCLFFLDSSNHFFFCTSSSDNNFFSVSLS